MGLFEFLILLVVAGFCGGIAQALAGTSKGGCLVSIALGFVGALLGNWLAGVLQLPDVFSIQIGGNDFPIVWSIIGAALFVAILSAVTGRRK